MKKFLLSLLLPLFILLGLQACGQTGPLYHSDEKAPIHVEDEDENE